MNIKVISHYHDDYIVPTISLVFFVTNVVAHIFSRTSNVKLNRYPIRRMTYAVTTSLNPRGSFSEAFKSKHETDDSRKKFSSRR